MRWVIVLLGLMGAGCCNCEKPSPTPAGPVEELRAKMAPVTAILKGASKEERGELSAFYRDFARVIADDRDTLKTTAQLRDAHQRAGRLMFADRLKGKHEGLATAVDKAIADAVGLEARPVTEELRARIVATFEALAWAVNEG